ncbi:hypothetical protein H0H87_009800, partial [Tephrocybe sp. NHM501043]
MGFGLPPSWFAGDFGKTPIPHNPWVRRVDHNPYFTQKGQFSAHNAPDDLTNICVENFAPNLMAHVQPADAGIIRCFKAHYRARFMNRAIDRYDSDISPADIYNIDILEAMCMANIAWKRKSGILPDELLNPASEPSNSTPSVPVSSLLTKSPIKSIEAKVSNALSHLEEIGVLQRNNQMDINELLNPTNENKMYDEGTKEEIEKDIHQAVVERRNAEQDREKNSGDDNENEVLNTRPSCQEALAAASTIQDYISDIDELFACTLEVVL